jgi:hypothetical protein
VLTSSGDCRYAARHFLLFLFSRLVEYFGIEPRDIRILRLLVKGSGSFAPTSKIKTVQSVSI